MYAIAGVAIGYFSIYFLVEMKREYGDVFVRPRNRVSDWLGSLLLSVDPLRPHIHLGLLRLPHAILHLVLDARHHVQLHGGACQLVRSFAGIRLHPRRSDPHNPRLHYISGVPSIQAAQEEQS